MAPNDRSKVPGHSKASNVDVFRGKFPLSSVSQDVISRLQKRHRETVKVLHKKKRKTQKWMSFVDGHFIVNTTLQTFFGCGVPVVWLLDFD